MNYLFCDLFGIHSIHSRLLNFDEAGSECFSVSCALSLLVKGAARRRSVDDDAMMEDPRLRRAVILNAKEQLFAKALAGAAGHENS